MRPRSVIRRPSGSGVGQHSALTLAVFRLGWRLTHQPPPLPESLSKPQRIAAHGLHGMLYLLILVQPISGYVHRMAGAHPVSFFGLFNLPVWVGKNEALRLLTDAIHDGGAIILAVLVAGHIAAALKHRFIDRDTVMQRMTTQPARRVNPAATVPTRAM